MDLMHGRNAGRDFRAAFQPQAGEGFGRLGQNGVLVLGIGHVGGRNVGVHVGAVGARSGSGIGRGGRALVGPLAASGGVVFGPLLVGFAGFARVGLRGVFHN